MMYWIRRKVDQFFDRESSNNVPSNVQVIDTHIEKFIDDDCSYVIHERTSETVHTDIFVIKPNKEENRDYYILLTSGMSALPMNTGEEYIGNRYAELMMLLPGNWNMNYAEFNDEDNWWPIRLLIEMTKYPHEENTWLGYGHTYARPNGESFSPSIRFSSVILLESITVPEDFLKIKRFLKRDVIIHSVIPLYSEELVYKLKYGTPALLEKFEKEGVKEIVDISRLSICRNNNNNTEE